MLLKIVLFLLFILNAHALALSERHWYYQYIPYTKGAEYDRAITSDDFDKEPYQVNITNGDCRPLYVGGPLLPSGNYSGYIYCIESDVGIRQICPSGTEVTFRIGGCVNITTNTSVLPARSRCASQPCQNGGLCYDFSSADAYYCQCYHPYTGLHCHVQEKGCPLHACGHRTSEIVPMCGLLTSDMALHYTCTCYVISPSQDWGFALDNCHNTSQLFFPNCEGKRPVGAVPFTNKGFYVCLSGKFTAYIESCPLFQVWNDTRKQCVHETI